MTTLRTESPRANDERERIASAVERAVQDLRETCRGRWNVVSDEELARFFSDHDGVDEAPR